MRHLNNPNNMKLFEVFESDNSLYIVFELLEGGQLFEKIKVHFIFIKVQIKIQAKTGQNNGQRNLIRIKINAFKKYYASRLET
jgi:serine/threonine protein kinase